MNFENILAEARTLATQAKSRAAARQGIVSLLARARPHFNWVGVYRLQGNELVLGPYVGKPTEHVRIPVGQGICGAAARAAKTIVVDDVSADPRYLACSLETRSELVVPILRGSEVLGEIDIDSDTPAAFTHEDRALVEDVAQILADALDGADGLSVPETPGRVVAVAAAILLRGNEVLIAQRHHSDAYGMQWEFPGGKVREGESFEQALARELEEELGILSQIGPEVHRLRHRYPEREVDVAFFRVTEFRGEVRNRVFEAIRWAPRASLPEYNFLEADRKLVERLAQGAIV